MGIGTCPLPPSLYYVIFLHPEIFQIFSPFKIFWYLYQIPSDGSWTKVSPTLLTGKKPIVGIWDSISLFFACQFSIRKSKILCTLEAKTYQRYRFFFHSSANSGVQPGYIFAFKEDDVNGKIIYQAPSLKFDQPISSKDAEVAYPSIFNNFTIPGMSSYPDVLHQSTVPQQYTLFHLGAKFWYFPLYYSFAFVIYVGYLLVHTALTRILNFIPGLQQSLS